MVDQEEIIDKIKKNVKNWIIGFDGEVEITVGPWRMFDISYEISDDLNTIKLDFYSVNFPQSWNHYCFEVINDIVFKMNKMIEKQKYKARIKELEAQVESRESAELKSVRESLHKFEEKIRTLIKSILAKSDINWWNTKISPQIREKSTKRLESEKTEDHKRGLFNKDYDVIEFLDFSDYEGIIFSKNYNLFKEIFQEKNLIHVFLKEIAKMRNKIFHTRTITKDELVLLSHFMKIILNLIEASEK